MCITLTNVTSFRELSTSLFFGARERKKENHCFLKVGIIGKISLGFSCDLMVYLVIS